MQVHYKLCNICFKTVIYKLKMLNQMEKKEYVGKFGQKPKQIWPKAKFRPSLRCREGLVGSIFVNKKSNTQINQKRYNFFSERILTPNKCDRCKFFHWKNPNTQIDQIFVNFFVGKNSNTQIKLIVVNFSQILKKMQIVF